MRAGELRHRLTIRTKTETQDGFGEPVVTWSDWQTVWCAFEPLTGREFYQAQQLSSRVDVRFRIRYLAGVTPEMSVEFDGVAYDIQAVLDIDGRRRELHLLCQRVV